jgi:AraC-like DNA-binding protein
MNPKIVRAIATMKDVAKVAGLSKTTVSRHLNGQLKLPAATVARIQEAIRELGYHPNSTARRLSSGRTEMIGFVTADIGAPFFAEIASRQKKKRTGTVIWTSKCRAATTPLSIFWRWPPRRQPSLP